MKQDLLQIRLKRNILISKQGQDYIASAIFRACRDYINEIDSKSGISTVKESESRSEPDTSANTTESSPADEIVFMVQIATSSSKTEIKPENFKGLK